MPIHGYPGNIITANPTAPSVNSASGVWTTEQQLQNMAAGNWPMAATQISRSLRFNSADSAYLNRTPASTSNQKILTISCWIKRGKLGTAQNLFQAFTSASTYSYLYFTSGDVLNFANVISSSGKGDISTNAVFRDASAWYHIVLALNYATPTATIYVNGVSQSVTVNTALAASNLSWNTASVANYIGSNATPANLFDGLMAEVYFIDGLALTPASFGQTNSATGVWEPRQYTGPYGTNGFYLNFSDNSGTTATTLGKDSSGNGNNWTPNNFSVTAGVGNDSLVDTPTSYGSDTGVGGEVRGNYCTFNQLINGLNYNSGSSIVNGNLQATSTTGSTYKSAFSNIGVSSGKWYFEFTWTAIGGSAGGYVGISTDPQAVLRDATYPFVGSTSTSWGYRNYDGQLQTNDVATAYGNSYTTNDVIGVALDMDNGKVWFSKNNTWQNSGSPTGGTNAAATGLTGTVFVGVSYYDNGDSVYLNAGQRPFAYTAPSGFKALCTQNLPTPTIGATSTTQAGRYFDIELYTGTGSSRSVTGSPFQPDFVWIKGRSGATDHALYDAVRGVQNQLESNNNDVATTETTGLTAFNSDGFTVGALAQLNTNTATYVSWLWNAGGSNATNTSGTITSTVRANTTAGFSIVTYTGTGANATVGHGLGVAPSMVICKRRTTAGGDWQTYHVSLGATRFIKLNLTDAAGTASTPWNDTAPTSTVFSLGTNGDTNLSGASLVAYCFAAVAGYSAFGSYTGNGSTDGPFIYTGFRPRFVLVKESSGAGNNWVIYDTARDTFNECSKVLYPNASNAEFDGSTVNLDILSNGFKPRDNWGGNNNSGSTYIYAAFAESPFKYALAR